MFGSARTHADDPEYERAREVGRALGEAGFAVITGGGPGTMEAANRGARRGRRDSRSGSTSCCRTSRAMNPYVDIGLTFDYFFTRKLMFVRYSQAFVACRAATGPSTRLFEVLTLIQTGEAVDHPVVLVGRDYWSGCSTGCARELLGAGRISAADFEIPTLADETAEIVAIACSGTDVARIARPDRVDERRHPLGERRVVDLEHVLGVPLARAREVERADEHGVVGDRDLGVHEVVDRGRPPRGRVLAREREQRERLGEQRDLPGRDAVGRPLAVDGVGLRLVDHARRRRRRRGRRARRASRAPAPR